MLDEVEEQRSGREETAGGGLQSPFRVEGGSPGMWTAIRFVSQHPDPSRWHQTASLKWHPACEGSADLAGCEARWVSTGTAAHGQQCGVCVCVGVRLHISYM